MAVPGAGGACNPRIVAPAGASGSGAPAITARIGTIGPESARSSRPSAGQWPVVPRNHDLPFDSRPRAGAMRRSVVSFNSIAALLVVLQFCFGCYLVAGAFRGRPR
jgi:hypothetical protein